MSPEALEAGYRRSYRDFYDWGAAPHDFRRLPTSRLNPLGRQGPRDTIKAIH